jgi:hypothetical protein
MLKVVMRESIMLVGNVCSVVFVEPKFRYLIDGLMES